MKSKMLKKRGEALLKAEADFNVWMDILSGIGGMAR